MKHTKKQQSLFGLQAANRIQSEPLAERMRPRSLDEIVGQDEVIGPNSAFGRILRMKGVPIPSVVLWGPPGVGKTTIARVIAETGNYRFVRLSGVLDGVTELRQVVDAATQTLSEDGRPTLALVDEIHRFNRAQQDAFLPHIESGLLTIIGQTTENVSFRLRSSLLSRLRIIQMNSLQPEHIIELIDRALVDRERGLGALQLEVTPEAKSFLAHIGMGDARRSLTALEWAALDASAAKEQVITKELVERAYGSQPHYFDQAGDYHYDTISAFIKSMRGSDPDAALYYMARALAGGEDPLFLTRRMIIFASEDAGCDPRALEVALNVDRAVERLGLPEAKIPLAQGVVYLASCAKSNASYLALHEAEKLVEEYPDTEIPKRLRNAPTELMRELGNSLGYRYPHDFDGAFVPERYLPEPIADVVFYHPTERGIEAQIRERLERYRALIEPKKPSS